MGLVCSGQHEERVRDVRERLTRDEGVRARNRLPSYLDEETPEDKQTNRREQQTNRHRQKQHKSVKEQVILVIIRNYKELHKENTHLHSNNNYKELHRVDIVRNPKKLHVKENIHFTKDNRSSNKEHSHLNKDRTKHGERRRTRVDRDKNSEWVRYTREFTKRRNTVPVPKSKVKHNYYM